MSRSMTGKYSVAWPYDTEALSSTRQPRVVAVNKLIHQARLAHPGLTKQGHELALPLTGLCQRLRQRRQLLVTSDKARQPARHGDLEAAVHGRGAKQLEDFYGPSQTFHGYRPQSVDPYCTSTSCRVAAASESSSAVPTVPCATPDSWQTHPRVVHVQVVADGPHQHALGVETGSQQHPAPGCGVPPRRNAAARPASPGRRSSGAQGVVLVGNRSAKHGHNAIATSFTVPSKRCTASIIRCRAVSRSVGRLLDQGHGSVR